MISVDKASTIERCCRENTDELDDADQTQRKQNGDDLLPSSSEDMNNVAKTQKEENDVNRWKAVVGSAAWRNYRRSRRLLNEHGTSAKTLLSDNDPRHKSQSRRILHDPRKFFVDDSQRHLGSQEGRNEIVGKDKNELGEKHQVSKKVSFMCEEGSGKPSHHRIESQSLVTKIDTLERLLDEQEDEIDDLQEKLTESKNSNMDITEKLQRKKQVVSRLEERHVELKLDLANARANEDELHLEMGEMVMVRDLNTINLTNEFNELQARMKYLEKVNDDANKNLENAKITLERKQTRLLEALDELVELKRKRQFFAKSEDC